MMKHAAIILSLLVAGCGQPVPDPAPDSTAASATPEPAATLTQPASNDAAQIATLAGEWRVAGIDGTDYNESVGLALSADAREIWWEPRCAGIVLRYRIDGFDLIVGPPSKASPAAADPARPAPLAPVVCTIGLPPRLGEVNRAIRAAVRVERTKQNGVLLSGGGHSLLLFSQ